MAIGLTAIFERIRLKTKNIGTFKRFEKKYLLDIEQYESLLSRINVYYDTDNYKIIRKSLDKPVYKEKLRVRSYGTPNDQGDIFFELKKKFKKEVFKRRVTLKSKALESYFSRGVMPDVSHQVMKEIGWFMQMHQPEPKIYIAYERAAFFGKSDSSLRITFDQNIRFRQDNLSLRAGDYGTRILDKTQVLMEIKVCGAMPLWLSHALDALALYPTSFSKYGYCYKNYIAEDSDRDENNGMKRLTSL